MAQFDPLIINDTQIISLIEANANLRVSIVNVYEQGRDAAARFEAEITDANGDIITEERYNQTIEQIEQNRQEIIELGYKEPGFFARNRPILTFFGDRAPTIEEAETYIIENGPNSLPLAVYDDDNNLTAAGQEAGFSEQPDRIEGEEAAAFLLNRTQGVLATLNEKIIENFFEERLVRQENVIQLTSEDMSLIINLIAKKPNLLPFFRIRTPYLSLIVPKIRLFKKVFIRQQDGTYTEREGGNLEFKFKSFTSNTKIDNITQNGFGRGDGVGIKNVNWSYEGNNPETVTSFINFDISLFFQNLSDLVEGTVSSADEAFLIQDNVDLIQLIGAGVGVAGSDSVTPFRFEIEAQLGWELDNSINHDLANDQSIQELRETIKNTAVTLRLSLKEHNINFNEDGTLTLDLSYFSAIDQVFSDEKLNVLAIGIQGAINSIIDAREEDREAQLASPSQTPARVGSTAINRDPCASYGLVPQTPTVDDDTDDDEAVPLSTQLAVRRALNGIGSENIINNYNNLFDKILSNNKVYILEINANAIMDDVGLEIGRPGLLTGVTQITNELERQATRSQERLDTTSLLAVQFTEDALRSLNSRYGIKITKPPSFDPTLVQASEQDLLRQRAQASDPEDTSTTSIDVDNIRTRMYNEMIERYHDSEDSVLRIEFIRLGDVIDNIIKGLKETPGSPLAQREEDFEFITGLFAYRDPVTGQRKGYNYSDMLISIDSFRMFFVEKIIRPLKTNYNLINFIIDLANKFSYVNSIRLSSEETFVAQEGRPAFSVFQGADIGLSDAARRASIRQAFAESAGFAGFSDVLESAADTDQAVVEGDLETVVSETSNDSRIQKLKFYFILRSNNEIISREGNESADIRSGIYHLKLGSDKGILKSISFRRDEIRGRREGRIVRAGALNINALREKYDASITIFGAPFIFPGMYIYIDPRMIGMGSGTGANNVSAANVLGLGGYYFINKVSNSISSEGNFETQLEASFNSFGPPDCRLPDLKTFSPPLNAAQEIGISRTNSSEPSRDLAEDIAASPAGEYVDVIGSGENTAVVPRPGRGARNY